MQCVVAEDAAREDFVEHRHSRIYEEQKRRGVLGGLDLGRLSGWNSPGSGEQETQANGVTENDNLC